MENNILSVTNLSKYFKEVRAVNNLSFQIRSGEIYGLLGPNGAGKSTTIKSILGYYKINGGKINVFGVDPIDNPQRVKQLIGYVSEEPILYESMTPAELFDFIASIRKLDTEKTENLMKKYMDSLDALQYYNTVIASLSRGNKQKIQILTALIHTPRLLILDEPLSGLDVKSSHVFKEMLQIHIDQGGSILLSTHIMEHAQNLCTRIGILKDGKLVAEGSMENLKALAKSDGDLEDIFLELTDQKEDTAIAIKQLRNG